MVLTFDRAWLMEVQREKLPRILTWALLVVMLALFAYNYLDNPMPGPYGACYVGRGGTKPCASPKSRLPAHVTEKANVLPVAGRR